MSSVHRHLAWASGAAALAVLLFAPERALEILLLALILACPILMVFMMRSMHDPKPGEPEDGARGTTGPDEGSEDGTLRRER